jgi:hypothetical protein
MGLDMYLSKKTYVKQWKHIPAEEQFKVEVTRGGKPYEEIKTERISYIVEELAYWRKFNALHNWFVQHEADGVDACQEIYVSSEAMALLLATLKEVHAAQNAEVSENLLPTASGFFFGGTTYDEYYYSDVAETIEILEKLLEEDSDSDYYYRASW